jgi:predicted O-methyltransferase YrrM
MSNNILVNILKAYDQEGYAVSVGLNPWRERPNGSFASLFKSEYLECLAEIPDSYYAASSLPLPDGDKINEQEGFSIIWQGIKVIVRQNRLLRKLYKQFIYPFKKSKQSRGYAPIQYVNFETGGGIAIDEIYFFENVLKLFNPQREFLIGIASGWSTIALGLINPSASLYGIDNITEGRHAQEGLELTKRIAQKLNIDLTIFVGSSPQDVPLFLSNVGSIDFVFVDGLHTNEQVVLDFEAVLPYLSESAIVVFHDVLNWNMLLGWEKIVELAAKNNFKSKVLRRTSSGMGVIYRKVNTDVEVNIEAFCQTIPWPM